jgi:hypothetical protein
MRISGFSRYALSSCVAAAMLAGCGGSQPPIGARGAQRPVFGVPAPDSAKSGLYISEYNSRSDAVVLGYPTNDRRNDPPTCSESTPYASSIAVDTKGNLIVPKGFDEVTVFKGPGMCGPKLASFGLGEWGGDAVDVASTNAADGMIAVAAIQDGSGAGSIEICRIKGGCTANLGNPDMNFVFAVAVSKSGDCWAASKQGPSKGYKAVLTYFQGCAGSGQTATHYKNPDTGGLDIDKSGNLVSISYSTPAVFIYSGCKPACKLIGGPFQLKGTAVYGHLNEDSTRFATADYQYGQVDVYRYSPTAITYRYSFNNGISVSSGIVGAAYNPRSKELTKLGSRRRYS